MGMSTQRANLTFEVGETVSIIGGAFSGLEGKIIDNDADKQKLRVTTTMFDREVTAEVDYDQVDKLA